jgi:hypothetical protein
LLANIDQPAKIKGQAALRFCCGVSGDEEKFYNVSTQSSGNTKGFSLYVCLALIVANILRILFW